MVAFENGQRLVGAAARNCASMNPESALYVTKRLIGRQFDDKIVDEIQRVVSYKIVRGNNGGAWCYANGMIISPEEVAAFILGKMKQSAERHIGAPVTKAVITVPAYFNDAQRQATKDAGRLAGLDVSRIINEPTAAALAYGLGRVKGPGTQTIAVYDLGGGTFDISILEISHNVFQVKATNGDTFLGGEDFDSRIVNFVVAEFAKKESFDLKKDAAAMQRVREAAEKAKKNLSSATGATINIPFIAHSRGKALHLNVHITRQQYETLVTDLIERTMIPCQKCLHDSELRETRIRAVILVGGMTRMPKVVEEVEKFFKIKPFQGINPDEAVALGAAIHGGILEGKCKGVVLLDVTPLSLGCEMSDGLMEVIIPKNTPIPASRSKTFTTEYQGQTSIRITVHQGEREIACHNKLLGEFYLEIKAPTKGVSQVTVKFDIDVNGIVHASATDSRTGKDNSIRVNSQSGLSQSEIQRMIQDANVGNAETAHTVVEQAVEQKQELKEKAGIWQRKVEQVQQNQGLKVEQVEQNQVQKAGIWQSKVEQMQELKQNAGIWQRKVEQVQQNQGLKVEQVEQKQGLKEKAEALINKCNTLQTEYLLFSSDVKKLLAAVDRVEKILNAEDKNDVALADAVSNLEELYTKLINNSYRKAK